MKNLQKFPDFAAHFAAREKFLARESKSGKIFEEKFVRNGNRSAASDQNIASPHSYSVNNLNQYTAISGKNLSYDANGNQTTSPQDAGASLKYDWNDRLIQVNATSSTKAQPATSGLAWDEIRYVYDPLGRRLAKTVTENGAFKRATRFIYDGWNVVEERTERQCAPGISKFLFWGEDLSGSMQGAGGVGGLLTQMEKTDTTNWSASYYHYDGNGNVATVSGPFRAILAKFSYDGFGRTITQTGAKSGIDITAIPYRFSTKPMELELATANTTLVPPPVSSGLYYYGYRFYSPNMGRWINRDPIREEGGMNLYGMVGNDAENSYDRLGLIKYDFFEKTCKLVVRVTWTVSFENFEKNSWNNKSKKRWKRKAQDAVESYFKKQAMKCFSSEKKCCICKDGVSVRVDLDYVDSGADFLVKVINNDGHRSWVNRGDGQSELDSGDWKR